MKRKSLVIPLLLAAVSVVACNSEKKGHLDSSKDGTENFDFKPPSPPVAPTRQQPAPKENPASPPVKPK